MLPGLTRGRVIQLPEIPLIDERQKRMDVQEVLLQKVIQHRLDRDSKAALLLEKVDVLMRDAMDVAHGQERIVAIDHVLHRLDSCRAGSIKAN